MVYHGVAVSNKAEVVLPERRVFVVTDGKKVVN